MTTGTQAGRLQQLLEEVLENSDIAWWEWDIRKNKVIANDLKVTMLGYRPDDFRDVGYQAYTDLLHPEDYERTMQAMRDHLEGRAELYQVDYRIRRSDGTYTWYMDRGAVIEKGPGGELLRLRGIVVDLGESLRESAKDKALFDLIRSALPAPGRDGGVVTLCSSCKRLKVGEGLLWMPVRPEFEWALSGSVSHGICPDCIRLLYPGHADELLGVS